MCLKTGCNIEARQLDSRDDIERLLGFAAPTAVRLVQLKQVVHETPDRLACEAPEIVDPLMLRVLALRHKVVAAALTLAEFWRRVARQVARPRGHRGAVALFHALLVADIWARPIQP